MKRCFCIVIIVAILQALGCNTERGAEALRSIEVGFERDVADIDSEMNRQVIYAFYQRPKYGRERMEPDYRRARQMLGFYNAFITIIDSLKRDLQKSIEDSRKSNYGVVKQKIGNNAGRHFVQQSIHSTISKILAMARLDSFEQITFRRRWCSSPTTQMSTEAETGLSK